MSLAELPDVTVLIANLNGRDILPTCLSSLVAQDYPAGKLRILVLDNASTDDSVALVRANYPQVELLVFDCNYGFAGANNRGAQAATTELIAFLNNDTRVAENWLSALVAQRLAAPDIGAVGATILSWDGQEIDFVRGVLTYTGHAAQRDERRPAAVRPCGAAYETLFACGGAMLIDRALFLGSGGFDEKFFAYFEDVDLGWRLWLMGYRVVCAPDAIAYHRGHVTFRQRADCQRLMLYERNALRMLYKNCAESELWRIFSAALLQAFARQACRLKSRGWDMGEYILGAAVDESAPALAGREGLAVTAAAAEFIDDLPELRRQRERVQVRRRRADTDIYALFVEPLRPYCIWHPELDETLAVAYSAINSVTGIMPLFWDLPRRVLVLGVHDAGSAQVGAALVGRPWRLAEALAGCGHEVLVAVSGTAAIPRDASYQVIPRDPDIWLWLHRLNPDVLVICDPAVLVDLNHCYLPVALDLAVFPPADSLAAQATAWRQVDFFTCASPELRVAYAGWFHTAGVDDPEQAVTVLDWPAAAVPAEAGPQPAGLAELDRFCRLPSRRVAGRRLATAPAVTAAGPDGAAAPVPIVARVKSFPALLDEARSHYRRGGLRNLLIETLGFLQRSLVAHREV
jgi:GT2 family glycosyltransferase